jgi:hypothetical protein
MKKITYFSASIRQIFSFFIIDHNCRRVLYKGKWSFTEGTWTNKMELWSKLLLNHGSNWPFLWKAWELMRGESIWQSNLFLTLVLVGLYKNMWRIGILVTIDVAIHQRWFCTWKRQDEDFSYWYISL